MVPSGSAEHEMQCENWARTSGEQWCCGKSVGPGHAFQGSWRCGESSQCRRASRRAKRRRGSQGWDRVGGGFVGEGPGGLGQDSGKAIRNERGAALESETMGGQGFVPPVAS
ncbi:hypothetical protein ACCO45_003381 [Purpureocillium lilacinum]|uniref:Uncharacterized protein n=1 Tax=Purpureocillium lilacinum TaxID=33203 RepID=A0ACC4E0N3_PURLI